MAARIEADVGSAVGGRDYPRNWHELSDWFPDDAACLRYLRAAALARRVRVPLLRHGRGGWWQMADGCVRCAVCRSETSVTAGTIFAGTRTPLVSWFAAVWYVVNQKQGVSALGLQRVLGLGSYQTAWAWLHKLRRAMVRPGRDVLEGHRRGRRNAHRRRRNQAFAAVGAEAKAIVVDRVEGDQAARRAGADATDPQRQRRHADRFVLDHVARGTEVRTDAWTGYDDIGRYRFHHVATNVSASGDPAHVVMPEVHLVASLRSSAGCSALTRARSATPSSTTTSTSSPSASTAAARATAGAVLHARCSCGADTSPPLHRAAQSGARREAAQARAGRPPASRQQ